MNTIRPAPARLVHPAAGERDARREAVGDVRVLVQPHPAAAALLEEGARDAPVRGAADAGAPAALRVRGDARELELDVYLVPAPQGLPLLVADVEPPLHLPAGDDVLGGQVGAADERGADGLRRLDGEDDVGGEVRAVDVERLVPARIRGVPGDDPRPAHAGPADVHRRVQPRRALPEPERILEPLHELQAIASMLYPAAD